MRTNAIQFIMLQTQCSYGKWDNECELCSGMIKLYCVVKYVYTQRNDG